VVALACCVILAVFVRNALSHAFIQDDAYIFLRYATNLVDGQGPVWNPGERVEGYTSFAWMLVVSAVVRSGVPVVPALHALTLACALGTLVLTFRLTRHVAGSPAAALLSAALLATDRTFAVWSTSGMETSLFAFLALAALAAAGSFRGRPSRCRSAALGVLVFLLSLARPEGLALSVVALGVALAGPAVRSRLPGAAVAAIVWIGGVGLHLVWRLSYYGRPLPNTFYAKVTGLQLRSGISYLTDFVTSFPVLSVLVAAAVLVALGRARRSPFGAGLAILIILYAGYLAAVGGDFMEFRLMHVLVAPACVLVGAMIAALASRRAAAARAAALFVAILAVAGNVAADARFEDSTHVVRTRRQLAELSTDRWVVVGRWFARIARPDESLATTAAGAIPYFSKLRCIDMLGLNDRFVASLPPDRRRIVGHQKWAPRSYLEREGITFIVGPPRIAERPDFGVLAPDELIVEIENTDPGVFGGRSFYLLLGTTIDRVELAASLRDRGVRAGF